MAEEIQVSSTPVDPTGLTVKRKRGRPRKEDAAGSESGSRRHRKAHSCDLSVGQVVSGVLDGRFDAGYMLTVRVGDTGTLLRGVVFEPDQSIPISAANDIAPHVSMLRRAELPIPSIEIKNHTSLKEKDNVTASVGVPVASLDVTSKLDCNSLTGTVKVDSKMEPVVNQSSEIQQSVHQNFSGSKLGSTTVQPSSGMDCNTQAVDSKDNAIAGKMTGFANSSATPVAVGAADARKEDVADFENQAPQKNTVSTDTTYRILVETAAFAKIEDPVKTQDNAIPSSVPELIINNSNVEPDSQHIQQA